MADIFVDFYSGRNNKRPDKPNEDFILADGQAGLFIMLDGVSRDDQAYPNPSPSAQAAQACAQAAAEYVAQRQGQECPQQLVFGAMCAGNRAVARLNQGYSGDFAPGACGIIALLGEQRLDFAQIGDCAGRIIGPDGKGFVFTYDFIQPLRQYQRGRRYYEYDKHRVRSQLCNNFRSLLGYGVLNGDPRAEDFIKCHSIPVPPGSLIALHSDGMEPWACHMAAEGREGRLAAMTAEEMVRASRAFDSQMGQTSDDTSVILIKGDAGGAVY